MCFRGKAAQILARTRQDTLSHPSEHGEQKGKASQVLKENLS